MTKRLKHLRSEAWDLVCLLSGSLKDVSFWTVVGARVYLICNVLTMLYVAYLLGVNPWITITSSLITVFAVWLRIQMRREHDYLALLLEQQKEWDVDTALKEYTELLERQKRGKRANPEGTSTKIRHVSDFIAHFSS